MRNYRIDIQLRVTKRDFMPKTKQKDGINRRSSISNKMKNKLENVRNKNLNRQTLTQKNNTTTTLNPLYEPSDID